LRTYVDAELMALSAARGVDFLHSLGIAHNDLRGGNILVNRDSKHAVIIDFGFACETTGDDSSASDASGARIVYSCDDPQKTWRESVLDPVTREIRSTNFTGIERPQDFVAGTAQDVKVLCANLLKQIEGSVIYLKALLSEQAGMYEWEKREAENDVDDEFEAILLALRVGRLMADERLNYLLDVEAGVKSAEVLNINGGSLVRIIEKELEKRDARTSSEELSRMVKKTQR